eukprot:COSAG05_NODE_11664_length_503_cov_0.673267_1_plen_113_part_10
MAKMIESGDPRVDAIIAELVDGLPFEELSLQLIKDEIQVANNHLVDIKKRADELNASDEQALRDAARDGDTAQVRELLAAGTDPNAADEAGRTSLRFAAWKAHEEAVVALAEG